MSILLALLLRFFGRSIKTLSTSDRDLLAVLTAPQKEIRGERLKSQEQGFLVPKNRMAEICFGTSLLLLGMNPVFHVRRERMMARVWGEKSSVHSTWYYMTLLYQSQWVK